MTSFRLGRDGLHQLDAQPPDAVADAADADHTGPPSGAAAATAASPPPPPSATRDDTSAHPPPPSTPPPTNDLDGALQRDRPVPDDNDSAAQPFNQHVTPPAPTYAAASTTGPFTPTIEQQTYLMMTLASMSGPANAMSPPPTVAPAQVSLPTIDDGLDGIAPPNALRGAPGMRNLESFARIEFADSVFQMTTYAITIGRDQRALNQARQDEKRAAEHKRRTEENAKLGLPPPTPLGNDRKLFSKSYVSEEGGMLGPESNSDDPDDRPVKRRKTSTAGSNAGPSQAIANVNNVGTNEETPENVISNRQYVSHTPGAAAVDLSALRPDPHHVPFVGIHSPGPDIANKTKAISRNHLKICYNKEEGVFEAIPLHSNGFFCEDVHYKDSRLILKCGDTLQIKDVHFRFVINGVERGKTGAEEYLDEAATKKRKAGVEDDAAAKKRRTGGKEMSFDFEQSHGNEDMQDTSDELSDVEVSPPDMSDFAEDDAEEVEPTVEADEAAEEGDSELKNDPEPLPAEPLMPQIPKKRGPGRPPKNGYMSKREQRLLKKQQQEMAKKTLPQAPPVDPPIKRKVGRPRKHPLPEDAGERPEKRKYKPRKPKTEDGAEGSDAERRAREKKEKKARPKSPPLDLKIEDYTEEQLQKPNKNYGVLIDETLTAAPDGLTLKQIYKRICERYPWFYFSTGTKGWESSVRHNLIGNDAFRKDETTNLWSRVAGVELDAGKKRKASSPDRTLVAQNYAPYSYPYNAHGAPGYPPGQAPPAGYGYNPQQPQGARPIQQYAASASPGVQPSPQAPGQPAAAPGYGHPPAPARPPHGVPPQQGAYNSPYASRPPPAANMPIKAEESSNPGAAVGPHAPPAPQQQQPLVAAPARTSAGPAVAPQAAAQRPSPASSSNAPAQSLIDARMLSAIVSLKNGLVANLKKTNNPRAETVVMSALNRCLGLKKGAPETDKMEAICVKGIGQVLDGFKSKSKSPTPGPSSASASGSAQPESVSIFEPHVIATLNGFKDVSLKALIPRLGDARAEMVTLSAIDRVLGLTNASIVPTGGGDGNLEGVELHLMNSVRNLIRGLINTKKPAGAV